MLMTACQINVLKRMEMQLHENTGNGQANKVNFLKCIYLFIYYWYLSLLFPKLCNTS